MTSNEIIEKKFRPEIEGIRAVASLLVVIYHIWLGRVSGGVDVFFVVSGFLITTSLLNMYQRNGTLNLYNFWLNLGKRLFPLAFTVLFFVGLASIFLLPEVRWVETVKEFIASILYYENWQLALNSVDYLAQTNEQSPFQHFWAMSIQGQFYLIWPLIIIIAIILSKILKNKSFRANLLVTFLFVSSISLVFSIYQTNENQAFAYFNTFTRLWEFGLGATLSIIIVYLKPNRIVSLIFGWLGILMLISTGIILPVSTAFPGYVALYPTLGAILLIIAGNTNTAYGVCKFLGSKPMIKLGSISYGIYLIHWPLLIFYYVWTDRDYVEPIHGLFIVLITIILSYLITKLVEAPIRTLKIPLNRNKVAIILTLFFVPVISVFFYWNNQVNISTSNLDEVNLGGNHLGAKSFEVGEYEELDIDNIIPTPLQARKDTPTTYADGCQSQPGESSMLVCEYGSTENYDYTVVIAGDSKSGQWLTPLKEIAKEENIRILNITKSGCRLSTEVSESDCETWNENVMDYLINNDQDLIITSLRMGKDYFYEVEEGLLNQLFKLAEHDKKILAIRDFNYWEFDPASCVEKNGLNSTECVMEKRKLFPVESWDVLEEKPSTTTHLDLSDFLCREKECRPVEGNVLVYRDAGHLTATYAKSLAPYIKPKLMDVLKSN